VFANKLGEKTTDYTPEETSKEKEENHPTSNSEAITVQSLEQILQIETLRAKYRIDIKVRESNGLTGYGIEEGFQWLHDIRSKRQIKSI